jgi:hypothetical protein
MTPTGGVLQLDNGSGCREPATPVLRLNYRALEPDDLASVSPSVRLVSKSVRPSHPRSCRRVGRN